MEASSCWQQDSLTVPDPLSKWALYRARKAGLAPPAPRLACTGCGKLHKGAHDDLCSRCWASLTPEGRADRAARVARARAKRKATG